MPSRNRIRSSSPLVPRGSMEFASDTKWVRILQNELTGTDFRFYGEDAAGAFDADEAILGTPGWNTTGRAFLSAGDNCTILARDMSDICRTDTLHGSIVFHYKHGGNTAGAGGHSYPFAYGNPFGYEGWGMRVNQTNMYPQVGITDDAGTESKSGLAGSDVTNVANELEGLTGIIQRDSNTGVTFMGAYLRGALLNNGFETSKVTGPYNTQLCINGKANPGPVVNAQSQAGTIDSDIIVVRSTKFLKDHMIRIAQDFDNNKWENSRVLRELGV